jgi:hypothetical protein
MKTETPIKPKKKHLFNSYYKVSQLKKSGWTPSLIKSYLTPDLITVNPVYPSQGVMELYKINNVRKVIKENKLMPQLQQNLVNRKAQNSEAIKENEQARKEIINWVNNLEINISIDPYNILLTSAIAHYNRMKVERDEQIKATINSDAEFLFRIVHNYLRHVGTNYDEIIDKLFGRVGKEYAYTRLKERVTKEINKQYPILSLYIIEVQAATKNSYIGF